MQEFHTLPSKEIVFSFGEGEDLLFLPKFKNTVAFLVRRQMYYETNYFHSLFFDKYPLGPN